MDDELLDWPDASENEPDSAPATAEPDLFAQTLTATRDVLNGAADAYRETFEDFQAMLPTFDELVAQAVRLPGTAVNRTSYLTEAFGRRHAHQLRRAIDTTPAQAGLAPRDIDKMAKRSIGRDARRTTVLSIAAGIPGGMAAAATIPADLAQFYGYLIRCIQKLTYLYGWRDLISISGGQADAASGSALVIMLGVMAGDAQADAVLSRLARLRAGGANDAALRMALEAKALSREVAQISDTLTKRLAQRLGGQVVGKAMPLVGAVISGTISNADFYAMAKRLQKKLKSLGY